MQRHPVQLIQNQFRLLLPPEQKKFIELSDDLKTRLDSSGKNRPTGMDSASWKLDELRTILASAGVCSLFAAHVPVLNRWYDLQVPDFRRIAWYRDNHDGKWYEEYDSEGYLYDDYTWRFSLQLARQLDSLIWSDVGKFIARFRSDAEKNVYERGVKHKLVDGRVVAYRISGNFRGGIGFAIGSVSKERARELAMSNELLFQAATRAYFESVRAEIMAASPLSRSMLSSEERIFLSLFSEFHGRKPYIQDALESRFGIMKSDAQFYYIKTKLQKKVPHRDIESAALIARAYNRDDVFNTLLGLHF